MSKVGKRIGIVLLMLCVVLSGCRPAEPTATDAPDASPEVTVLPSQSPEPTATAGGEVNLAVLSGPTGVGAAKLLADHDAGKTNNRYTVTVCTDNQQVVAGLTNGDFDIAAIATNVAANLYQKSNGAVQMAAVNTLGVLYILGPADSTVESMADLAGKTLYATGEGANPEFVLKYLLGESGLDAERDVNIVWQGAEEVTATMLSGKGEYCMLPVPAATALEVKSEGAIQSLVSLSDVWDGLRNGSQLTMGCVVVRTAFAQEHPEVVQTFLDEYQASIDYVQANVDEMAQVVTDYGITPSAGIAKRAIPQCNLTYLDGEEMRDTVQGYFEVLCAADPASIGGSMPDDAFYRLDR